MSYHTSLFSITYTMRLTPFDSFKVEWLNSCIFYELYGCRDIGTQVRSMDMNDDKREEEITLSTKFEHQANHIFMKCGK